MSYYWRTPLAAANEALLEEQHSEGDSFNDHNGKQRNRHDDFSGPELGSPTFSAYLNEISQQHSA